MRKTYHLSLWKGISCTKKAVLPFLIKAYLFDYKVVLPFLHKGISCTMKDK